MNRFIWLDETRKHIRHNIEPDMFITVIENDEEHYDAWGDCYELFEYKGNKFVIKWQADKEEFDQVTNYSHIRSILRRAWHWYKAQVYIEEKEYNQGPMEDDRYKIEKTKDGNGWVCADKVNLYVIIWQHGGFNQTQKIELLEDFNKEDIMYLSRWGREMGEWLMQNHKDKL